MYRMRPALSSTLLILAALVALACKPKREADSQVATTSQSGGLQTIAPIDSTQVVPHATKVPDQQAQGWTGSEVFLCQSAGQEVYKREQGRRFFSVLTGQQGDQAWRKFTFHFPDSDEDGRKVETAMAGQIKQITFDMGSAYQWTCPGDSAQSSSVYLLKSISYLPQGSQTEETFDYYSDQEILSHPSFSDKERKALQDQNSPNSDSAQGPTGGMSLTGQSKEYWQCVYHLKPLGSSGHIPRTGKADAGSNAFTDFFKQALAKHRASRACGNLTSGICIFRKCTKLKKR